MKENYKEIEFDIGSSIERSFLTLIKYAIDNNVKACGSFNGKMLYSDKTSLDSAYLDITGFSYDDFKAEEKKQQEEYEQREIDHINKIPELAKQYMEEGHKILSEDKWSYWDEIVPIRLNDLYKGMELRASLDIIKLLKESNSFDQAKKLLNDQGHSGMSYSLVCGMIKTFYDSGDEFIEYLHSKGDI